MTHLQEDLDWRCYRLYGLTDEDLTYDSDVFPIELGQRAFEIVLARKMARGEVQTTWFERHGSTPITELPAEWPEDYKRLVERRIEVIETNPQIALIEQPEYKRRWNTEPWESQVERALKSWLLDRLESYFDFDGRMNDESRSDQLSAVSGQQLGTSGQLSAVSGQPISNQLSAVSFQPEEKGGRADRSPPLAEIKLYSVAQLTDVAARDSQFMEVACVYRDDPAFDVQRLVEELVSAESVPLLPVLRYKPSGLRKRAEWERTWELQRLEDENSHQLSVLSSQLETAGDAGEQARLAAEVEQLKTENCQLKTSIPVPPKYTSADFLSTGGARYWALRGKLDVPKERWVSFPHCAGADGTLMLAWAGYDHLQLARAISGFYVEVQERLGGRDDQRLAPLLACLIELLPWLKQWHNEVDPEFNVPMGDYFEGFIQDEARQMNKTVEEIKNWTPPAKVRGSRGRKK